MTSFNPGDLYDRRTLYLDGRWVPGLGERLTTVSPVTGQVNGMTVTAARTDIDAAVAAARRVIDDGVWPVMSPGARAEYIERLCQIYCAHAATMQRLISAQNGCPLAFIDQVEKPVEIMEQATSYAEADRLFGRHALHPDDTRYAVRHEPVGVVAAITSWDMPQKSLLAKLVPALLAGCAVIVRPAPETPLDALLLADMADAIGLPPGVLNVLPSARDSGLLEYLVTHPGVDKVSFTGSTSTGAQIARLCAADFRRVTLECGGKSAAIITEDADLDQAVASLKYLALANSGQLYTNLTRLVVHKNVEIEFTERLRAMMRALTIGDPADRNTYIGPLVSQAQQRKVLDSIKLGREEGSRMICGVGIPDLPGWYVNPALFIDVDPHALVAQHEIFGPVLTVHTYRTEPQALAIANGTRYGMTAAVYTQDMVQADRLASGLKAGTVRINGAATPVHAPAGGFKHSGIGRELGPEGIAAYQEIKVVAGLE